MATIPDFRLETYFSHWKFEARDHLATSDVQTMSLSDLLALADDQGREQCNRLSLGYTATYGLASSREEIAATYQNGVSENVLGFAELTPVPSPSHRVRVGMGSHASDEALTAWAEWRDEGR
ncbi:hypothetical protein [Mycobacteroides chelonae]|uniref:hypothetical protein n=1 Tax=Mycobacteroides chelonae TaxID=1774 RepID=UPI000991CCE3|nr:hypothetical protein [Mycobacteroides chelonae]